MLCLVSVDPCARRRRGAIQAALTLGSFSLESLQHLRRGRMSSFHRLQGLPPTKRRSPSLLGLQKKIRACLSAVPAGKARTHVTMETKTHRQCEPERAESTRAASHRSIMRPGPLDRTFQAVPMSWKSRAAESFGQFRRDWMMIGARDMLIEIEVDWFRRDWATIGARDQLIEMEVD